ncbi:MAG: hypothetical protein B7Y99_08275 [Caulobacterales bacterium 32-69-10]|nr:MAG: hypothetical protein B7Y99_08275 [Caulobacterales bacterium 32-69-10]
MADTNEPAEGHVANPPNRKRLLLLTAGAALAGALIVLGAVLPAEYNVDPLGIGKATGLSRLWAPPQIDVAATAGNQPLARFYPTPFRSDEVIIKLDTPDNPEGLSELEYKVAMKKGATYVYSWQVEGIDIPEEFYSDFHGHTLPKAGEKMVVSTYRQATGSTSNGTVVAPFDGIHGFYLQNQSEKPVQVRLHIAGFYELIPPGQEGNLARIKTEGQIAEEAAKPRPAVPDVLN